MFGRLKYELLFVAFLSAVGVGRASSFQAGAKSMRQTKASNVKIIEDLIVDLQKRSDPQEVNLLLLSRLISDPDFLGRMNNLSQIQLILFHFEKRDAAYFESLAKIERVSDLRAFYDPARLSRSKVHNKIERANLTILFVEGEVDAFVKSADQRSAAAARPSPESDSDHQRRMKKIETEPVVRYVMDPALKPYFSVVANSFGALKPDSSKITFFRPSQEDIISCEKSFLDDAYDRLKRWRSGSLRLQNAYRFASVYSDFTQYDRQVVGWAIQKSQYFYMKFSRHGIDLPSLEKEYERKSGGTDFFEFQCLRLPKGFTCFNFKFGDET